MALDPELVAMLCCPVARAPLLYFADVEGLPGYGPGFLFCPESRLKYPVDPLDFPVLLAEEAVEVDEDEARELVARAAGG